MLFLIGVLIMVVGVAASIALHEIGHMVPAKRFGVRVPQYMIGFGPTIWSRKRGETEYGFKAIPLGGYIRMIGMYPPKAGDPDGVIRASSTGRMSQLMDEARAASFEEIRPGDEDRVFYKLPTLKKIVVMFGGPFMNLIIGSALTLIMMCGVGMPHTTGTKVSTLVPCLSGATTCTDKDKSPAAAGGIRVGDVINTVDGQRVNDQKAVTNAVRQHGGQTIPVGITRDGKPMTITVKPAMKRVQQIDAQGNGVTKNGDPVWVNAGYLGLGVGEVTFKRESLASVPGTIGMNLSRTAEVLVNIPAKMKGVAQAAFGDGKRDVNGPVSVVGESRIAGDVASSTTVNIKEKVLLLVSLIASLNFALFVFNLIPLLPLDGGHIAGAIWEAIKRPLARRRGVQGAVYADVTKALPLTYAVSVLLLAMSVLLMYADVVNPIKF